jgi:hypothetical protein
MGGFGSGSYYRWDKKTCVEEVKSIDVRQLKRWGVLNPGYAGSLSWTSNGEPSGDIRYMVEHGSIVLIYRYREYEEEWESVEERVLLDWTDCNYGGNRPWFICPISGCGRRVARIYAGGKYFGCRHCYNLAYNSQCEGLYDRMARKARKIRKRLDADMWLEVPVFDKPKGMHWKTFEKLQRKERQVSNIVNREMERMLGLLRGLD